MKILTANDRLHDVRERGFLDGTSSGGDSMRLVTMPSGLIPTARYYDIYRSNPWLYAAVNHISWGLSRIPLKLYQYTDSEGARRRVRGDVPPTTPGRSSDAERLDRVMARPQPGHGRAWWMRRMATDTLVAGNSLSPKERDGNGRLLSLPQTSWRDVTVHTTNNERDISHYEIHNGIGEARRLLPEDVLHLSVGNDPERAVGMSPIAPLRHTIALFDAMYRHMTAFFANQARPSGHIALEKGTDRAVLDAIREQIKQLYTAPENAGKVLVTSGKWETISESPEHSQILQLIRNSREEVAAAYGVPPPLMGILDRAVMANVRELRSHDLRAGTGSWAVIFEEEFNAQILAETPTLAHHFFEFDMNEALRPDLEVLAKALRTLQNTYSLNERRRVVNLPKIDHPDADAVWLELNLTPIGDDEDEDEGDGGRDPEEQDNGTSSAGFIKVGPRPV